MDRSTAQSVVAAPSVVLFFPARDEAASVAAVVRRVPAEVCGHPVLCVVVDDDSADGTGELAARGRRPGRHQHRAGRARRRGPARAGRRGRARARTPSRSATPTASTHPRSSSALVAPILAGEADYVVGSRFSGEIQRMLPHRRFGNRVLTVALARLARRPITDGQSGYRALSARAAASAEIIHDYNYAQVLTLDLVRKGFRYAEVPISYSFREHGRSFVRLDRYLRKVVPGVVRELRAP